MTTPAKPTHADIFERLGEIAQTLEAMEKRMGAIETKVMAYDRLKERVVGALMAGTVLLAALWWLTKDKLAAVFGVSGS